MFLYEKDLRDTFWSYYKNRKALVRYQFENPARDGGVDLLTLDEYMGEYQVCAFEFKMQDIKKAFLQAEANVPFCHKSFIVIPQEKETLIRERYTAYLNEKRYVGVIGVEPTGKWNVIYQPMLHKTPLLNQAVLRMIVKGL